MAQILEPGEVTGPVPGIPHVLLPERATVFGRRYLVCPLCASQWHLVRAKCVACDSARDLATVGLDLQMAEAGYTRFGANPLLVPGAG